MYKFFSGKLELFLIIGYSHWKTPYLLLLFLFYICSAASIVCWPFLCGRYDTCRTTRRTTTSDAALQPWFIRLCASVVVGEPLWWGQVAGQQRLGSARINHRPENSYVVCAEMVHLAVPHKCPAHPAAPVSAPKPTLNTVHLPISAPLNGASLGSRCSPTLLSSLLSPGLRLFDTAGSDCCLVGGFTGLGLWVLGSRFHSPLHRWHLAAFSPTLIWLLLFVAVGLSTAKNINKHLSTL